MRQKGIEFEKKCIAKLNDLGFQDVQNTPISGDFGADIVAYYNGSRYIFQCKDMQKRQGGRPVQEILGAKSHYKAQICVVISNSGFTSQAYEMAKENFVLLWESQKLFNAEDIKVLWDDSIMNSDNANITSNNYDITKEFYNIKNKLGHTPTLPELDKTLRYKIRKEYGKYTTFLNSISENLKRSAPPKEMIKEDYLRIKTKLGRQPTVDEIKHYSRYSYNQFQQYPLTKLQKECGDTPKCDRSVTNEDLKNEYLELAKVLGHNPNGNELDKYGKHKSYVYIRRFGSLKQFYGLPEISAKELQKEPLIKKEIIAYYLMLKLIFDRQQIPVTYTNIKKLSCNTYKPLPISRIETRFKNFQTFLTLLENNESVTELENNLRNIINSFICNEGIH